MDLDALREALDNWERIGVKGPVYEAARAVLDSEEAWWCFEHNDLPERHAPWGYCRTKWREAGHATDCSMEPVAVVRVRLLAEDRR